VSGRHIILIGLPGSGKSTVGALVAAELGLPFVDLDDVLVRRMGMPVDRIIAEFGEPRFRELEHDSAADQLAGPPAVLAPGGGWAAEPGNLEGARATAVFVWLRVTPAVALGRAAAGAVRPLLAGGEGLARITALLAAREPFYRRADAIIGNDRDDPAEAVAEIVAWLRRGGFA
jgi:shikimate kinase